MTKGIQPNYNFDIIKEFINRGKSLVEIAKYYNVHRVSMGRVLRKAKIDYPEQRKIIVNHDFFENIDSEIKAYLLGFFVADGCVYNKHRIGLCIAEQDEYIVKLFAQYIAPLSFIKKLHNTKSAKNRQPQLFLRISSSKLVSDLAKLGIFERKTYKPMFIPNISEELKWHFIRGYFDGDGYFGNRIINKKYNSYRIVFTNGDPTILNDIQNFTKLGKVKSIKKYAILDLSTNKNVMYFLHKMYDNANFKLPRKFNKFLKVNTEVSK